MDALNTTVGKQSFALRDLEGKRAAQSGVLSEALEAKLAAAQERVQQTQAQMAALRGEVEALSDAGAAHEGVAKTAQAAVDELGAELRELEATRCALELKIEQHRRAEPRRPAHLL